MYQMQECQRKQGLNLYKHTSLVQKTEAKINNLMLKILCWSCALQGGARKLDEVYLMHLGGHGKFSED